MAWRVLRSIDHHVWVWQGGSRHFDEDELATILSMVEDDDTMADFTKTLIMRLGSSAENSLRVDTEIVKANPALKHSLGILTRLSTLNDPNSGLGPDQIAEILRLATVGLCRAVKLAEPIESVHFLAGARNPSIERQEERHFGKTTTEDDRE